ITPTYESARDSSAFYRAELGFSWRLPVATHWDVVSGGEAWLTRNTGVVEHSQFDKVGAVRGRVGVSGHYGRQRFGVMLRGRYDSLGGDGYRNVFGVTGQYNYFASKHTRIGGFLQYSRFDYQYSQAANQRNVDTVAAG